MYYARTIRSSWLAAARQSLVLLLIDEIQYAPRLLPHIKMAMDAAIPVGLI